MALVAFGYLFLNLSLKVTSLVFNIRKLRAMLLSLTFLPSSVCNIGELSTLYAPKGCVGLLSQIMPETSFLALLQLSRLHKIYE